MNGWVIAGLVLVLGIGAGVAFIYSRKKGMENLFNSVYENAKQVPKKKRRSFLLFMFKETITAPRNKKKAAAHGNKLNNRVYVETQLIKMTNILKDPSKVTDKKIKRSLTLLKEYTIWEEKKRNSSSDK